MYWFGAASSVDPLSGCDPLLSFGLQDWMPQS
jgi:hypothetical protein